MSSNDFVIPDFLQNQSVEEISRRMLDTLPDNLDTSENSMPYDYTIGTAIEKANMAEYTLVELLKDAFPQWASGVHLDYHGEQRTIYRKSAEKSKGEVTVTVIGTVTIPAGTRFSTEAQYGEASTEFESTAEISAASAATVPIQALVAGTQGNVTAGRITVVTTPVAGIVSVTNAAATAGGLDEEDDEALRQRILAYDQNQENSNIGCAADYSRWATSVPGVGSAVIVPPVNDTGVITIVITDSAGNPADTQLCQAVNDYIMSPSDPEQRLAQVNAQISVVPPATVTITIAATVETGQSTDGDTIKAAMAVQLKNYYKQALADGEVRLAKIIQIMMSIQAVEDVSQITINGGTTNVVISNDELPVTAITDITLTISSAG